MILTSSKGLIVDPASSHAEMREEQRGWNAARIVVQCRHVAPFPTSDYHKSQALSGETPCLGLPGGGYGKKAHECRLTLKNRGRGATTRDHGWTLVLPPGRVARPGCNRRSQRHSRSVRHAPCASCPQPRLTTGERDGRPRAERLPLITLSPRVKRRYSLTADAWPRLHTRDFPTREACTSIAATASLGKGLGPLVRSPPWLWGCPSFCTAETNVFLWSV